MPSILTDTVIDLAIKNFPAQQKIFDDPARFKIVVKGRRFGLTKGAANDYIACALKKEFKYGLWGDTVNANIDKYVKRYFLPHLNKLPSDQWDWKKIERTLYIRDSYIDFRSADRPENWEGFGYDKFFLNEAGIILKDEYLWYNAIRPMLEEYKARGVIGGTPKGKNLLHTLAAKAQDPNFPDYAFYHYTSYDNPYLPKSIVDNMAMDMNEVSRKQEIFAEFLDDGGEVFRGVRAIADAVPQEPVATHYYVMGLDLAKVQDYTVITVYDRETNKQVYQDRFNTLEWPFQKRKIKAVADHYNRAVVRIDATGLGDPIADDLSRAGVSIDPIVLNNENKKEMIERLSINIEQKRIHILPITDTLLEFDNFSYEVSRNGHIIYGAREGYHDDIVISHGLATWDLQPLIIKPKIEEMTSVQQAYLQATGRLKKDDYVEEI